MGELQDREAEQRKSDREFAAAIHGVKLQDGAPHARRRTVAESAHERMKRRRGIH